MSLLQYIHDMMSMKVSSVIGCIVIAGCTVIAVLANCQVSSNQALDTSIATRDNCLVKVNAGMSLHCNNRALK